MKQIFTVTIVLFFMSIAAHAQLKQGIWLVGGNANFSSSNSNSSYGTVSGEGDLTTIGILPNAGYFLFDKFAAGIRPGFSLSNFYSSGGQYNIEYRFNTQRLEAGPFVRYYFLGPEKLVNILADASYQHGFIWQQANNTNGNINTFSFNAGPVVYFNSFIGLEFTAGYYYRNEKIKPGYEQKTNAFQVGIGFQIHLE